MNAKHIAHLAAVTAVAVLGAAIGAPATAATGQNIVKNGSFENGMSNWAIVSYSSPPYPYGVGLFDYADGAPRPGVNDRFAVPPDSANGPLGNPGFDPVGKSAASVAYGNYGFQQSLTLAPGRYRIGLDVQTAFSSFSEPAGIYVWLGKAGILSGLRSSPFSGKCCSSFDVLDWTHYFADFEVSTPGTVNLIISGYSTMGDPITVFDRVYVQALTVPEPSTYALMFLGLGALGLASRRRRHSTK